MSCITLVIHRLGLQGRWPRNYYAPVLALAALCLLLAHPSMARADGKLPDTGITKCYDGTQEIPCPQSDADFSGQDAQYNHPDRQLSYSLHDDTSPANEDTVTDNVTGLVWMQATADTDGDGSPDGMTWDNAVSYCEELENYAGNSDWRLPTYYELFRLVDYSKSFPDATIDGIFSCETSHYWSGSLDAGNSSNAWGVHFYVGSADSYNKGNTNYVRCVRSGT